MTDYLYDAVVVDVHDGDTLTVNLDLGFRVWQRTKIRLHGINAPELKTPEGKAARKFLLDCVQQAGRDAFEVESIKDRADKYGGRYLGVLRGRRDGASINEMMVKAGHAKPWDGKGQKPV